MTVIATIECHSYDLLLTYHVFCLLVKTALTKCRSKNIDVSVLRDSRFVEQLLELIKTVVA